MTLRLENDYGRNMAMGWYGSILFLAAMAQLLPLFLAHSFSIFSADLRKDRTEIRIRLVEPSRSTAASPTANNAKTDRVSDAEVSPAERRSAPQSVKEIASVKGLTFVDAAVRTKEIQKPDAAVIPVKAEEIPPPKAVEAPPAKAELTAAEKAEAKRARAVQAAASARAALSGGGASGIAAHASISSMTLGAPTEVSVSSVSGGAPNPASGGSSASSSTSMDRAISTPTALSLSSGATDIRPSPAATAASGGSGRATADEVRAALQRNARKLAHFGEKFPRDFQGRTVSIKITVGEDGKVVDVIQLTTIPEDVVPILIKEIRGWTLPEAQAPVSHTLKFIVS